MKAPLVQDSLVDRHERHRCQLRVVLLVDEPLLDSLSNDASEEMAIFVMHLFQGRKEIHVRIEFRRKMVQEQAKVRMFQCKVCAETDCAMEFSYGV